MGSRSGGTRSREVAMTTTTDKPGAQTPTREEGRAEVGQITKKPRLTTSAMIASLAAEGQPTKPAPFGHALTALAAKRARDRRPDRRPEQVHRPLRVRPGLSRSLLPDGHGGATADERRRRDGARRLPAVRHHLRRLRVAAGLRLHLPRDRRGEPERQDRLRPAGTDHRLRARATRRPTISRSSAPCPT